MSPNLLRCRHYQVEWLNSHSCKCSSCGKFGHWFENAALVMWIREDEKETSGPEAFAPSNDFVLRQSQPSLPNMAG